MDILVDFLFDYQLIVQVDTQVGIVKQDFSVNPLVDLILDDQLIVQEYVCPSGNLGKCPGGCLGR